MALQHTRIYKVQAQGREWECHLDSRGQRVIREGDHLFTNIAQLVGEYPTITESQFFEAFARLANFLWKGFAYEIIEDIPAFQEEYLNQVEFEQNTFDYLPYRITSHGVFDVTVIHPPQIIKGNLVFFVKNDHTQLPYKVSCPFPFVDKNPKASYELLPYKE